MEPYHRVCVTCGLHNRIKPKERQLPEPMSNLPFLVWVFAAAIGLILLAAGWELVEKRHEEWMVIGIIAGLISLVGLVLFRRNLYRGFISSLRFVRRSVKRIEEESRP